MFTLRVIDCTHTRVRVLYSYSCLLVPMYSSRDLIYRYHCCGLWDNGESTLIRHVDLPSVLRFSRLRESVLA